MMRSKPFLGGLILVLMAATALVLQHMKSHQQLGVPGVKTRPIPGSNRLEILLPEMVSGYTSEILTNNEDILSNFLPPDTSYRARRYLAQDDFGAQVTVVLMGNDRTSIHRPEFCLTGQGWEIDTARSTVENISMARPVAYDLPVNKLITTKQFTDKQGRSQLVSGIYVYWFLDATHLTASATRWKAWLMPRDLLLHGRLERWAYISVFSPCLPGQEAATYERMKILIATTVPDFQLIPTPAG